MTEKILTFLMFGGRAEEAMTFYVSLLGDAEITGIERYGADEFGKEGTMMRGEFSLAGQRFICTDTPIRHDFSFTPSFAIFVNCESEAEIERLFATLSEGGQVLMPLDAYPFSPRYAWLTDRFGVSWQLNLSVIGALTPNPPTPEAE